MDKIEDTGFLSDESKEKQKIFISAYLDIFKASYKLNRLCMSILNEQKIDWNEKRCLAIQMLFLRLTESFQSVILLLEMGIITPSKVISRSMLESVFTLVALEKQPELLQIYLNQQEESYYYNLKSSMQFKSENLRQASKEHELEKKYIELKKSRLEKRNTIYTAKVWAKKAELEDLYITYYNLFSEAIHSNPASLDEHADIVDGKPKMQFGPSDGDLYEILKCCIYQMLNAAKSISNINKANIDKELDEYVLQFENLDDIYSQ
jgi:hypothetical protein